MNIQFQNPGFLYALFLIAIPIIIHLFNFKKYKTVYFSNLQFIKEIELQTRSKSKLKQLLVLLFRILTIIALVLAFAQIFIPSADSTAQAKLDNNNVAIYIDNSYSMSVENRSGMLLEIAKTKARNIIEAYPRSANFYIITNNLKQYSTVPVSSNRALEYITQTDFFPQPQKLSRIFDYTRTLFDENPHFNLFVISDFQRNTTDISSITTDSSTNVYFIPIEASTTDNIILDSCWFATPNRVKNANEELIVQIKNTSENDVVNLPIQLFINDSLRTVATGSIKAESTETITIPYNYNSTGLIRGRVEINDFPILYDNTLHFSYIIEKEINILEIFDNEKNKHIESIFSEDNYFTYIAQQQQSINYSEFSTQNLIVVKSLKSIESGLEFELFSFIRNGGTVLIIPNIDSDINTYNNLFGKLNVGQIKGVVNTKLNFKEIDYNHPLFKNVFARIDDNILLPFVNKYYEFELRTRSNTNIIIKLANNSPFLMQTNFNDGVLYILSTSIGTDNSNFVRHPLFVAGLYNIAVNTNKSTQLYYTLGKDNSVATAKSMAELMQYTISESGGANEFIPEIHQNISNNTNSIFFGDNIIIPGTYFLKNNNEIVQGISLNYDRKESSLEYYTNNEIIDIANQNNINTASIINKSPELIKDTLLKEHQGVQLWKLMIVLCLAFILVETLLLRFWRN